MNSTPAQINEAIAHVEQEIRDLNATQAGVNDQRHLLASLTGQNQLSPSADLTSRIARCLAKIEDGIKARDALGLKKAALAHLQDELANTIADNRKHQCQDTLAQFDRTKALYKEQSEQLLITFRRMYQLSREYTGLTGREIMFEADYKLELPALRRDGVWASPFTTGMEVRM